ncbi:MAG: TRAP transporter small permease, partial [Planctomycetota bacterium]
LLATGVGPINGDFEIVEAGMAFTIFAFIPLCQLKGAHAVVDVFTSALPLGVNRVLRMLAEAVFAGVMLLIAWQLLQGTISKMNSGQTTFLLEFPVWWSYAASVVAAFVAAVMACYVAAMRAVEVATGRSVLPDEAEAGH